MTPRDARQVGESWGVSSARARHAGDEATAAEYRRRLEEESNRTPVDLRAELWSAYFAAYDAEWARLEGGIEIREVTAK